MRRRIQLAIGSAVYGIAFLLPAVKTTGQQSEPIYGWTCAVWSLWLGIGALNGAGEGHRGEFLLLGLSGLVNPLVVAYLGLWAWPRFARIRWGLCAAVAVGMVSSWAYFSSGKMVPTVGHFVWIVGIAAMLSTEIKGKGKLPGDAVV